LRLGLWWCFLTCHHSAGAGGKYQSVSKLCLLIDIRVSTGRFFSTLSVDMYFILSRCDILPGLYGHAVCTMHCRSICTVPLPSHVITTHASTTAAIANMSLDRTSSPRYKITLSLLRYSQKL